MLKKLKEEENTMNIKDILKKLVSYNTIKDNQNKEIMDFIESYLKKYNFTTKRIKKCLVAYNDENPNIGFIGHTDTVDYESWDGDPFILQEKGEKLIGLGACDMKGGLAAILSVISKIDLSKNKIALYFTNNEEISFEGITMLYLSGMVIDPKCQGDNVSQDIIKDAYKQLQSDLISLRTQNIAMAKSLLSTFDDSLLMMPGNINEEILYCLRQVRPFKDIDDEGVIRECYPNQLYYNLNAIESNFGKKLQATDALGVVIEPKKESQKSLSRFNQVRRQI